MGLHVRPASPKQRWRWGRMDDLSRSHERQIWNTRRHPLSQQNLCRRTGSVVDAIVLEQLAGQWPRAVGGWARYWLCSRTPGATSLTPAASNGRGFLLLGRDDIRMVGRSRAPGAR